MPCSINVDRTGAVGAINMERLNMVGKIIDDTIAFIDNVYIPDLLAIASFYKHWGAIGGGLSSKNVMSYGEFPDIANDQSNKSAADAARRDPGRRPHEDPRRRPQGPGADPGVRHALAGTSTPTRPRACTRSTA